MSRGVWKGPFVEASLLKKVEKLKKNKKTDKFIITRRKRKKR